MKERPTSITVIAWILIVMGGISILSTTMYLNNPIAKEIMEKSPIPANVQYVMMYVGLIITIVSGIAMLKGHNWARFLYVIWSIVGFVIGIATSPMKTTIIPGLIFFLVIAFFLFRPIANNYFAVEKEQNDAEDN